MRFLALGFPAPRAPQGSLPFPLREGKNTISIRAGQGSRLSEPLD